MMKRTLASAAAVIGLLLAISTALGAHGHGGGGGHGGGFGGGHGGGFGGGHGGFGGGHIGGFSGGHMGGFSGGHVGGLGGGGMHFGGPSSFGGIGGMRSAPSIGSLHAPSLGSVRSAPGIGSLHTPSLGSIRSAPNIGSLHGSSNLGGLRVSPNISGLGASGLNLGRGNAPSSLSGNLGSSLNRGGSLSRATVGNVRPNIGSLGAHTSTGINGHTSNGNSLGNRTTLGNRTALGGLGQTGLKLNNGASANTTLRPNIGNVSANNHTANGRTAGSVHVPLAGRVTPQNLNNFLSINSGRNGVARHSGLNGHNGLNVSHVGGANIHHSFNRLNTTQIHNINNNLHNGFRHHHGFNNRGFGFNTFGFGFGSPFWNNWGLGVRGFWNPYGYYGLFGPRFWATNYCYFPWRRSYYWWGGYPYSYWWNYPTWGGLCNWFPYYNWSTPYYYGYGPGGNIVYSGDTVYMNDVPIATAADYAASAAALAAVPEPVNPDAPTEWLPLGTFALSENEADKDPARVVQLAVDKDGIISGTMHNKTTNQTFPVQGRVDKETQRVAFTIGDAKDVVFETGIYNLTQQQTPVLVHGDGREETYLLLRLELPKDGAAATAAGAAAPAAPAGTPPPPLPGDAGIIAPAPVPAETTPPGPAPR